MISRTRISRWRRPVAAAVSIVLLASMGCATVDRNVALSKQSVTPFVTGDAAEVSADELAEAMLQAGFSRAEILRHGPKIRNALATAGSAQVSDGRIVDALFAVHSGRLYVTSRLRGTFIQPLKDPDGHGALHHPESRLEVDAFPPLTPAF